MERPAVVDPRYGLRTVRRTADQLAADTLSDHRTTTPEARLRDVEDDLHALLEEWAELRGISQAPTSTCPVCGRGWRLLNAGQAASCVGCASLRRANGYEDTTA